MGGWLEHYRLAKIYFKYKTASWIHWEQTIPASETTVKLTLTSQSRAITPQGCLSLQKTLVPLSSCPNAAFSLFSIADFDECYIPKSAQRFQNIKAPSVNSLLPSKCVWLKPQHWANRTTTLELPFKTSLPNSHARLALWLSSLKQSQMW